MPGFSEQAGTLARWRRYPGLERVDAGRAALTFDDGPDPEGTPLVLDALEAEGLTATFFVVGEQLARHSALAREAAQRGHELALHGWGHRSHRDLPDALARDDVAKALGALEAAAGVRATRYRPPYGVFNDGSYEACAKLGLEPVYWSAWGLDWETLAAERIAELAARDLEPGAIVLLHDSTRYAHRTDVAPTADAVRLLAKSARARDLPLGPL